jgi:hypothetical protein
VAIDEAAIPIPVSLVDQIATSVVAYRKSSWLERSLTYGMRMIVAVEALVYHEYDTWRGKEKRVCLHGT